MNSISEIAPKVNNLSNGLKVYAGLACAALKGDHVGEYAIWTLARCANGSTGNGSGVIDDDELKRAALDLAGWDDRKYRRTRNAAIKLGLMTLAADRLYLCSLYRAAHRLGAQRIGHCPIGVPVEVLSKVKSWRAALRDSFLAGQKPNPISQHTIETLTGLTPRTQYTYSKMNRRAVTVIHNYARIQKNFNAAQLASVKEFIPGAYLKDGDLWQTLGNTYEIDDQHYPRLRPGGSRRAQSSLNVLVNNAAGQQATLRAARIYHETRESAYQTLKRAGRGKTKLPDHLYILADVKKADDGRPLYALWESL